MKKITLISDWKLKDPYVATFKGDIAAQLPDVSIFDITHAIEMFNMEQTAFILKSSFPHFPENTLHVILTGSSFSVSEKPILVECKNHFFLGMDNGIFSLIFDQLDDAKARQFDDSDLNELPFLDKFVQMMKWHFNGELDAHTSDYQQLTVKVAQKPSFDSATQKLNGQIIYIDSFCNAVTDIPVAMFQECGGGKPFVAKFGSRNYITATKFSDHYEPKEGEIYLVANRMGYIEITMFHANVAVLADLCVHDPIDISFS